MKYNRHRTIISAGLILLLSGCISYRTDLSNLYTDVGHQMSDSKKDTSVLFLFEHSYQKIGYDTFPKMRGQGVKDFDNILRDALTEISNIEKFDTHTKHPNDINNPSRRDILKKLRSENEYTVAIEFFEESSFKKTAFSATISGLFLTVIPMPYSSNYTITAEVYDQTDTLVKTLTRQASLHTWVQFFFMFAYPFYPLEGKREEIYSMALHNIFKQIEDEGILTP